MAIVKMSITPSVLTWAREDAGYTIEDAAKKFPKIAKWESGESSPTYKQLKDISNEFSCSIAVFFFPEPPKVEPVKKSFRTLPDAEKKLIPAKIVKLLKKAQFFQYSIQELQGLANIQNKYSLANIKLTAHNIREVADNLRKFLKVSIHEQINLKNQQDAFKLWRNKIEQCGIYVFKQPFGNDDYSGFCLYDENNPLIYINNSNNDVRQTFTLFHEVAHLLLKTGGIDKTKQYHTQGLSNEHAEVICNRFAAEFLVPDEHFRKEYLNLEADDETISNIANVYHVSRYVVLRRYLDCGKITPEFYRKKSAEYEDSFKKVYEKDAKIFLTSYYSQVNYHSTSYLKLIFQSYYNHIIGENELSEYIPGITNINKFEERYLKSTAT
ncbi:MAG: ImmA/IrrE family metallo-endopeptidase [Candidatus Portiera sp.]|nr:ImmA/IrrE family metallo-endopeptidase [Portiera sp.]